MFSTNCSCLVQLSTANIYIVSYGSRQQVNRADWACGHSGICVYWLLSVLLVAAVLGISYGLIESLTALFDHI